tara:strand:+ start:3483 stop:5162 length:1680 start_codon:yes stop_codon:yes gene_type:complete
MRDIMTIEMTDKFLVNRNNETLTCTAEQLLQDISVDFIFPNPGDVSPLPGSGTEVDPFLLTTVQAYPYGVQGVLSDEITISNQPPNTPGVFTNLSDSRFDQPTLSTDANGTWTGRLVFNDTPASTSDQTYVGNLQIGSVFFRWSVELYSETPSAPPVIGSVNLVETNPDTAPRFTDQSFVTTVTMSDQGKPQSSKQFEARVEGSITTKGQFRDTPSDVSNVSNAQYVVHGSNPEFMFDGDINTGTEQVIADFKPDPSYNPSNPPSLAARWVTQVTWNASPYPNERTISFRGFKSAAQQWGGTFELYGQSGNLLYIGSHISANGNWIELNASEAIYGFAMYEGSPYNVGQQPSSISEVQFALYTLDINKVLDSQRLAGFSSNVEYLSIGDIVTQTNPQGTFASPVTSVTDSEINITGSGFQRNVEVVGPEKTVTIDNVTKYLEFNTAGTVSSLRDTPMNPAVVLPDENPQLTLTFPSTFPSGQAPDDELGAGTTLTVDVKAVNDAFEDEQSSNTVQPSVVATAAPEVRSLTESEFAQQALKFATYQNRKDFTCGNNALTY